MDRIFDRGRYAWALRVDQCSYFQFAIQPIGSRGALSPYQTVPGQMTVSNPDSRVFGFELDVDAQTCAVRSASGATTLLRLAGGARTKYQFVLSFQVGTRMQATLLPFARCFPKAR